MTRCQDRWTECRTSPAAGVLDWSLDTGLKKQEAAAAQQQETAEAQEQEIAAAQNLVTAAAQAQWIAEAQEQDIAVTYCKVAGQKRDAGQRLCASVQRRL